MSEVGQPPFVTTSLRLAALCVTAGFKPSGQKFRPDGLVEFEFPGLSEADVLAAWTSPGTKVVRDFVGAWDSLFEIVKHGRSRNGREIKG